MMRTKRDQTQSTINNKIENWLMGSQTADGRNPDSFGAIVAYDGTLHGVDPTAVSWGAKWQPVKTYKTGTTAFALSTEFRAGMRKFGRALKLYDPRMRLLIAGEDVYDAAQSWAEGKLQVRLDEIKSSSGWGDLEMFDCQRQDLDLQRPARRQGVLGNQPLQDQDPRALADQHEVHALGKPAEQSRCQEAHAAAHHERLHARSARERVHHLYLTG